MKLRFVNVVGFVLRYGLMKAYVVERFFQVVDFYVGVFEIEMEQENILYSVQHEVVEFEEVIVGVGEIMKQ